MSENTSKCPLYVFTRLQGGQQGGFAPTFFLEEYLAKVYFLEVFLVNFFLENIFGENIFFRKYFWQQYFVQKIFGNIFFYLLRKRILPKIFLGNLSLPRPCPIIHPLHTTPTPVI